MFKDILDLLIFKPRPIEYYQRYSMLQIVLIIMALGFTMGTIAPLNNVKLSINYIFFLLVNITILLVAALFFKYWLEIKEKQAKFIAIFSLALLTSTIDLLMFPLHLLDNFFWFIYIYLFENNIIYVFIDSFYFFHFKKHRYWINPRINWYGNFECFSIYYYSNNTLYIYFYWLS